MAYMNKPLPEHTARECLGIARRLLGDLGRYVDLYPPGHEGPHWSIKGELNDSDIPWPYQLSEERDAWPKGVFAEPINHFALSLSPDPGSTDGSTGEALAQSWERAVADGNQWAQQRIGAKMARLLQDR